MPHDPSGDGKQNPVVQLKHGAGGPAMRELVTKYFLDPEATGARLGRGAVGPEALDDGAAVPFGDRFLVFTSDAHVVKPVIFPGGDIGRLSVCGVVNDLAVMGATEVIGLTSSVIVEEGFSLPLLEAIHQSMHAASREAAAHVLTGDTKVMGRGELDGIVLATSGIGLATRVVRDSGLVAGDLIVVTGTVGDHGLAVLGARHALGLEGELRSDVAPLNGLVQRALGAAGGAIHAMKDPTRGGVTAALSEMASKAHLGIVLEQSRIPLSAAARAAADLLGIDPLGVANEGKALIGVAPERAEALVAALRTHPLGHDAAVIGRARSEHPGEVLLDTGFGHRRLLERDNEPLPRIC